MRRSHETPFAHTRGFSVEWPSSCSSGTYGPIESLRGPIRRGWMDSSFSSAAKRHHSRSSCRRWLHRGCKVAWRRLHAVSDVLPLVNAPLLGLVLFHIHYLGNRRRPFMFALMSLLAVLIRPIFGVADEQLALGFAGYFAFSAGLIVAPFPVWEALARLSPTGSWVGTAAQLHCCTNALRSAGGRPRKRGPGGRRTSCSDTRCAAIPA